MHNSIGKSSFGPLEPVSAIPQTKGPNKVYSVLLNVEQAIEAAVIVRYQPRSRGNP